jgi:hypothetical protein
MDKNGDLRGGRVEGWLVTGWFTPDYRPLAEAFAAQLDQHGVPYHLWAKPALGVWNTGRKPAVAMETMDAYPGKTVVLMDVDCIVHGDIAPVARIAGDVGIVVIARNVRRRGKGRWAHWLAVECSSRVIVFQPTEGARAFVKTWADTIERSTVEHDEHSMAWAYLVSASVRFRYIDQRYDSAHDEQRRAARGRLKLALRAFERRFLRTGRTRASRLKGEMSKVLLQAETTAP